MLIQNVGLSETLKDLCVVLVADAGAVPDTGAKDPDGPDLARVVALVVAMAFYPVDHTDSVAAAAFEGSANRLASHRASCCQQREAAEQVLVVDSVHVHPIAVLVVHR